MTANKDWIRDKNVVSPVWNNGYGRYDLSIEEVIQKIRDLGYNLEKIDDDLNDDASNYELEIHSDNGMVISQFVSLVLKPKVYRNGEDITDNVDPKFFKWIRTSSDPIADAEWNLRHAIGIKNLFITHEDVKLRAVFHCAFLTGVSETNFVANMYAAYMSSINRNKGE